MEISHLDDLVLTVKNIQQPISFYQNVLNMEVEYFGEKQERVALKFNQQKINLHLYQYEFEPKAKLPTPGSADLCFIIATPLAEAIKHLQKHQIEIEQGPIIRTGALGRINSIYCRDPDHNLIELANYI